MRWSGRGEMVGDKWAGLLSGKPNLKNRPSNHEYHKKMSLKQFWVLVNHILRD